MTVRKTPAAGSYDEFLATVFGGETHVIRGVKVTVPTDVPLAMEQRLKALEQSESEDDIREMISLLFKVGPETLDQWRDDGMGAVEFKTVLAWGSARAGGADITFVEAYEAVKAAEDGEGKAPNRANRRAASKKPSTGTGGRSARTSAASTASRRKNSPR